MFYISNLFGKQTNMEHIFYIKINYNNVLFIIQQTVRLQSY